MLDLPDELTALLLGAASFETGVTQPQAISEGLMR
jgi:hypothetical protein